jgi:2-haloacid dehalogenase
MYKPSPQVYRLVCKHFDVAAPEIVFVSSNRWDVMGAAGFGFRAVWVNRAGLPDEYGGGSQVVGDLGAIAAMA